MDLSVLILLRNNSLQLVGQFVDALAATADNGSWACSMQSYAYAIGCTLDVHSANVSHAETGANEFADGVIACQKVPICLLICKPVTIRVADDTESKTDGMYFLTQMI